MRTVRIVLRTEVPEDLADSVLERFERAAEPLLKVELVARRTMLNARTIDWNDGTGFGRQVASRKVI